MKRITIIIWGLLLMNLSFGQKNFNENIYPDLKAGKYLKALDPLEKEIAKKEKNTEYLKYWQAIALVEIAKSERTDKAYNPAKTTLKSTLKEVFSNSCDVKKKTAEYYGFEKMKGEDICAKARQNLKTKEKELGPIEKEIEKRKAKATARKEAAEKRKKAEDNVEYLAKMDSMPDFAEDLENMWKVVAQLAGEKVIELNKDDKRFMGSSWVAIKAKMVNSFESNSKNFALGRWKYIKEGDKEFLKFYTVSKKEDGNYSREQDQFKIVELSEKKMILESLMGQKFVLKSVR